MKTYEKITTITPVMVQARIDSAVTIINREIELISDRYCRRHEDGCNWLDDMDRGAYFPAVPSLPAIILKMITYAGHTAIDAGRISTPSAILTRVVPGEALTPAQLVTLISALDSYADQMRIEEAKYRQHVADAIARHVAAQSEAARQLVGLVAAA